ncbi:MAG: hypothetical protein WAJ94_12920 [Candidatus Cybelea sp.]
MGDRYPGTLKREALAWALTGASRYAIAVALVSILLAILMPDAGGERFATTAYLAAIFAAIVVGTKWLVFRGLDDGLSRPAALTFPRVLAFTTGLIGLLSVASALVAQPGAESALILYCLAAVALAAVGRAGAFAWIHAKLSAGDRAEATIRFCAIVGALALALNALLWSAISEFLSTIAYAAALIAATTLAWRLAAAPAVGAMVKKSWAESSEVFTQVLGEFAFARLINASVIAIAASILMACVLRRPFSEPFATVAYLGGVFAAAGVGMECWRRRTQPSVPAKQAESYVWSAQGAPPRVFADVTAVLTLENVIRYSVVATLAAFVFATPLPRRYGEPFATIGYVSAVVLTLALALECRRALRKRSAKPR